MSAPPGVDRQPRVQPRRRGLIVVAWLYVVLALNAWAQVLLRLFHFSDDPPLLVAMQLVVGAAAALTVWGTWRSTRWASLAALAYGVFGAALLASLAPLLLLPPDARGGLWTGAAVVLLFGLWSAWYLRPRVE